MSNNSKNTTRSITEGYRGNGVQIPTYTKTIPMPKKVTTMTSKSKPSSDKK